MNDSLRFDQEEKRRYGFLPNPMLQFTWAERATYHHPVLMRAPGVLMLGAGVVLVLLGIR